MPQRLRRDEAVANEPETEQLCKPFGIVFVGLPSGHVLDVLRISHHDLHVTFENLVYGHPVNARALHDHVRTPFAHQPFAQLDQISFVRSEPLLELLALVSGKDQQTHHEQAFVHIDSGTSLDHHFHTAPPFKIEEPCTPTSQIESATRVRSCGPTTKGDH